MDFQIQKARQDAKKKEDQRKQLLAAIHSARQRLFRALGPSLAGGSTETMNLCNKLTSLPTDERLEFVKKNWNQALLDTATVHLVQLQKAEEVLQAFDG